MDTNFIFHKLTKYSQISSLPGREHNFLEFLEEDFSSYFSWFKMVKNDFPYFLLADHYSRNETRILFIVHTDRIPLKKQPILSTSNDFVKGQLDNTLIIAILRELVESKVFPFDVLFTTREEEQESYGQVNYVLRGLLPDYIPICLDVVPVKTQYHLKHGHILIPKKDGFGKFRRPVVQSLQRIAKDCGISIFQSSKGLATDLGLANKKEEKARGGCLGLPIINYHTYNETTSWKCIVKYHRLLRQLIFNQTTLLLH